MPSKEVKTGQGALAGGTTGAMAGSVGGPPGAAIGAGVGAGIGGILAYIGSEQDEKAAKKAHEENQENLKQHRKYDVFWNQRSGMPTSRAKTNPYGAALGGLVEGAAQGGIVGDMYANPERKQRIEVAYVNPSAGLSRSGVDMNAPSMIPYMKGRNPYVPIDPVTGRPKIQTGMAGLDDRFSGNKRQAH